VIIGPLGAGKSAVAAALARRGAFVVDADSVGHAVLAPGGEAFDAVAARWPSVLVDEAGGPAIDRGRLAAIAFADPAELAALEELTHPHIVARIEEMVGEVPERVPVVVEMPLIDPPLEWHRLVVVAPTALRYRRAVGRGMGPEDVTRRMQAQPDVDRWRAAADSVIDNDGTLENLEAAVDNWWAEFVSPPLMEGRGGSIPGP
jgi:dephospho-CoA kinase